MEISKLQALGNDFLVAQFDLEVLESSDFSTLAVSLCDRHYGVGADGLMALAQSASQAPDVYRTRIFNADGSEAEMSGNGVRCAAAFLFHFFPSQSATVSFETRAGCKIARLLERKENTYYFETNMGRPVFAPEGIPMVIHENLERVAGYPLSLGAVSLPVTALSMGNPHCVVFMQQWGEFDQDYLGFSISNHPVFPNRTNVEFVHVLSRQEIRVGFWERGVGATLASGTGGCAAAVASIVNGFADERLVVRTPSGRLNVEWKDRQDVLLTGPAEILFKGEFLLPSSVCCDLKSEQESSL
jgi:diaminopimelate epimerase